MFNISPDLKMDSLDFLSLESNCCLSVELDIVMKSQKRFNSTFNFNFFLITGS